MLVSKLCKFWKTDSHNQKHLHKATQFDMFCLSLLCLWGHYFGHWNQIDSQRVCPWETWRRTSPGCLCCMSCGTPRSSQFWRECICFQTRGYISMKIFRNNPDYHHSMLSISKIWVPRLRNVIAWSRFVLELQCSHHQLVGPPMWSKFHLVEELQKLSLRSSCSMLNHQNQLIGFGIYSGIMKARYIQVPLFTLYDGMGFIVVVFIVR